jgi:hypothetical protein
MELASLEGVGRCAAVHAVSFVAAALSSVLGARCARSPRAAAGQECHHHRIMAGANARDCSRRRVAAARRHLTHGYCGAALERRLSPRAVKGEASEGR